MACRKICGVNGASQSRAEHAHVGHHQRFDGQQQRAPHAVMTEHFVVNMSLGTATGTIAFSGDPLRTVSAVRSAERPGKE